jgi:hypothetical protein
MIKALGLPLCGKNRNRRQCFPEDRLRDKSKRPMQGEPAPAFDFLDGHRRSRLYRGIILTGTISLFKYSLKNKLVRRALHYLG